LRDNITYGVSNYSEKDLWDAIKFANAADFINQFPEKLNTVAGERGLALSGGQKQRIAIARAVLKNPKILILDEATSALDAASESLVQDALDNLVQGRTVITIAHRLSTIQKADRIIMLENGKVVENGTFSELTSVQGKFRKMIQNQLLDE
jgi:subfamily B ATP-binding cassette protein MsbA